MKTHFVSLGAVVILGESRCAVFKELWLPQVENLGLMLVLVTQVGYRYLLNQVTLEDQYLFLGGVVVTFLSHGLSSVCNGLSQNHFTTNLPTT
jgi:hypothetical protein